MRGARLGSFLVGLAVLLAACGNSGSGTPAPSTGAPIIFGAAVSLTGSQSKEGGLTKQGYDLWLDWINQRGGILVNNAKHPVQLIYEDDQSNANLSATLVEKLITVEKAQFILGPYGSSATASDAIVVEKDGIPMAESIAINKAAKQLGLNAKIFAYSVGPSTPDFISALGADANYVYDGSQWTPQVKYRPSFYLSVADYVKAYQKKYNSTEPPDYHVAESTAGCLAFEKAIENAGSLDPSKVRDALAALDVMTFFGEIKFDSRGINIYKPMVVEQIQSGTHYTVFPAAVANGQPQYPTPTWSSR